MEIVGIYIEDIIRVCKGGKPAAQLEIGCQKGGNYFCFNCKLNSLYFENIFHSFSLYHISIQDRLDKIFCSNSTVNRMKTRNTHYFTGLHKADIISELHQRSVKFSVNQDLPVLKELLACEVHGIQSVPALMFSYPNSTLEERNLQMYEALGTEPLHDISNHVKNLYEEIPFKFEKETKKSIVNIINVSFKNKQVRNSADHRESLLTVCKYLQENHPNHFVTVVIKTLAEMQEILYLQDSARSPQNIF